MTPKKIKNIFQILDETWPNAECELVSHNDFQFLLAVLLSAQTTDKSVNKAMTPILEKNPNFSPADLIEMGTEKFWEAIKTIGLARTKSKNAVKTAEILMHKYNGIVPKSREALESLPGVGRKTTNVVLAHLANEPVIAVDTHVARVSQRIGLVKPTKDRLKIEQELMQVLPKKVIPLAHHLLIFHGRYLCKARAPQCSVCSINALCLKRTAMTD